MHPIEVNLPLASPMSTFSNSLYRAHDLPRVKSLFQPSSELEDTEGLPPVLNTQNFAIKARPATMRTQPVTRSNDTR